MLDRLAWDLLEADFFFPESPVQVILVAFCYGLLISSNRVLTNTETVLIYLIDFISLQLHPIKFPQLFSMEKIYAGRYNHYDDYSKLTTQYLSFFNFPLLLNFIASKKLMN